MNCCKYARLVLTLFAAGGMASGAIAGALGPTSRGTVSISITVPPHVSINPAQSASKGQSLCLETNGLRGYHVAVLGAGGSRILRPQGAATLMATAIGSPACSGVYSAVELTTVADRPGSTKPSSREPVTLLIVPD